ncbi:MAG: 1-(5-phosphoribosyl)-5-[Bacteroidales bacterium]|nr:1-(5-phosphoribosyl)-5-[(5-phosphoribosylamino)methylideneamino]imidazole-4-carboxamide isomerase [Bacteroidales bacterium]
MIEIIPAIDIIGGKCTRLSQGDYATQKNYGGDPTEWARAYADCGVRRLHLVDLEGAKEAAPKNLRTLEAIASLGLLKVEWGGGIKDDDALASVWNAGADWAIIGSIAAKEPDLMLGWLREYGSRIILGADVRDGKVAVSGWLEDSGIDLDDLVKEFLPAVLEQSIVTDISRDGMLQGPSFDLYRGLQEKFPELKTIVSGGVSSLDDVRRADELGLPGIIVGKAIYENRITLNELAICLQNGSFPA